MQRQPLRFPSNSAASSPRTNPLRSNNERDRDDPSSSMDRSMSSGVGRSSSGSEVDASQTLDERLAEERRGMQKLNKVVQEFFNKAALVIVGSRYNLSPKQGNGQVKSNKWFNVVLPDTNDIAEPLLQWKTLDVFDALPPPLVIEMYLDLSDLTASQALVILDNQGRRWDIAEALSLPAESNPRRYSRSKELVIERWRVEIGESSTVVPSSELVLPDAYKKAVVLFRSLFTYTRILPGWQYFKRVKGPANNADLKLKYRIISGDVQPRAHDTLETALIPESGAVTSRYVFEPSLSPVGPFCISVTYRENCDFRVDDSESLLSSHFMASDDTYFRPSLSPRRTSRADQDLVPGSLPARKHNLADRQDPAQAYGSLSTFHGAGQLGTSPLSALRDAHWPGGGQSPSDSPPQKSTPTHRAAQGSKSSLRSNDATVPPHFQRRTSVSFQPFKAGSLASSPASGMMYAPVPPSPSSSSLGRDRPFSQQGMASPGSAAQKRNSLNPLPQQALRNPIPIPNDTAIASSASGSPKTAPIARYSSSFSNRRHRFSSASAGTGTGASNSRTEDGEASVGHNSSGKGSASSSTRVDASSPDVTVTAASAAGAGGNGSGTMQADDDNLKDFIKLLEQKKELKSFNRTDEKAREATIIRTTAALSKYQRMRDSNAALSDSLGSSLLLHRSSSSSSRQLSAVPPMISDRGGSFESSSPGKPVSPHTPHTPAIPSRLSAGSVLAYDNVRRSRSGARSATGRRTTGRDEADPERDPELPSLEREGSNAIPIPTSPRAWSYVRRSSSVAQQHRHAVLDDADADLYGLRSASLPTEERGEVSMSELLRLNETSAQEGGDAAGAPLIEQGGSVGDDGDSGQYSGGDAAADGSLPFRTRMSQRGRWRVPTASSSNSSSTAHPSSSAPGGPSAGSRGSRTSNRATLPREEDDEPLLFAMSELEAQSRRSLEEGRGGSYLSAARGRGGTGNSGSGRLGGDW